MSILIKGIDLPKEGWYLDLVITDDGVVRYYGDEDDMQIAKAVELPDHGDLIDRDALPKYTGYALSANDVANAVINANAVIPAERSEECGI